MTYLVLRFYTLSNVAMTVPVIASLSELYPEHKFLVVAKKRLSDMFYGMSNVQFVEADNHTNLSNLRKLYHTLCQYPVDAVIDLQDDVRTRWLRWMFHMQGKTVYAIDRMRVSKILLTLCKRNTNTPALPSEITRYQETFAAAGLLSDNRFCALAINRPAQAAVEQITGAKHGRWIGIAPFAKKRSNMLPYRVTKDVIQYWSSQQDTRIFLFGAGKIESEMLTQWASVFPNTESMAGRLSLGEELELMRKLDVMICMDSANQHLSSLVGLRAVSIWCGTHPIMGLSGWKQQEKDIIQLNQLRCRPCTYHGTNQCRYMNFACREITSQQIIQKVYE